jgi:FAD synthetase
MCFGTFDILHLGHINYFQQAKQFGDHLIVVIARDKTKQDQNKKIIFSEEERLEIVKNIKLVDEAVLGNLDNHYKIILEKKPEIIVLGYDQEVKEEKLAKDLSDLGITVEIKRAAPYKDDRYKSSKIRGDLNKI